jgi:uncharacterized membrane protein HdeD (DUF308 family)
MTINVGGIERPVRMILGVVLLLIGYLAALPAWATVTVYVLGVIAIVTGAVRFCPVWFVLGINTFKPASSGKK